MIEVYDALCLREPWLELILLGYKTLETRTKCMRKTGGVVVLVSSLQIDKAAWGDPGVGGRLDEAGKQRALSGCGRLAGLVDMGGFRSGVPGVDDAAALIQIRLPDGRVRWVSACANSRRVERKPTVRLRPNGEVQAGASQGFFKIPKQYVETI